jgi:hypothetical protein
MVVSIPLTSLQMDGLADCDNGDYSYMTDDWFIIIFDSHSGDVVFEDYLH